MGERRIPVPAGWPGPPGPQDAGLSGTVYRAAENQATITVTITDTTPGIIAAILTDPRTGHDTPASPPTGNPATDETATSTNSSVDVPHDAIATVSTDFSPWYGRGNARWCQPRRRDPAGLAHRHPGQDD
jgi:hypothetical protein